MLTAETGSGKTTLLPLLLLDEPWLANRRILVLEPRRPAARMAAQRMAELLNESVGATVGYQVRFERRVSADTRIEVLTEGLFLRRVQDDPELTGVGLVVFDEFHERNLQGDLALALVLDVTRGLREDLRLLVMSASLDPAPLCRLMPASSVHASGRQYPVSVQHDSRDVGLREAVPACLRLVSRALEETAGDVLVFLPGRREIQALIDALQVYPPGAALEVLPLFGELDSAAQDRVLRPKVRGPRRVIAATDIAETSLTIEGISAVVDSGLARRPLFDVGTGLTRLRTIRVSRASALQRAGRAGRLGPGRCYRAWSEARHARLDAAAAAEIAQADLAPVALEVAAWGADVGALSWPDAPPQAAWAAGLALLRALGAVHDNGALTARGRRMARFPAHPRLAHLLDSAASVEDQRLAADIAAILSERDPLRRGNDAAAGVDLTARLDALSAFRRHRLSVSSADVTALRRVDQAARQLRRLCKKPTAEVGGPWSAGTGLLLAYPDRVACRTAGNGRRYLLRSGRAALLPDGDRLSGSDCLVVAAVDGGDREGRIDLAAPIDRDAIETTLGAQITSQRELRWDERLRDVVARRVQRLDAIILRDEAVALQADDPVLDVVARRAGEVGLEQLLVLPEDLMARVELIRRLDPAGDWPDCSQAGLTRTLPEWLAAWLPSGAGLRQVRKLDLSAVLTHFLGRARAQRLDKLLPVSIDTPAGTRRRIRYEVDAEPVLALPMQEMFGEAIGPSLVNGRLPVVLHLLSPAGRPLQVTRDLAGFWAGAYADVRKEMRGRYPKHHWPEDPASASATRSVKRRRPTR